MKKVVLLAIAAALASGADLSYKPGSKLNLIFASGGRCEVKVVTRAVEWVTVVSSKAQPSCPTGVRRVDLRTVVGIQGDPSWTRRMLGVGVWIVGMFATPAVAFGTRSEAATIGVLTGSVVGGVAIGASGYKWTLYLNQSTLEEVH